MSSLTQNFSKMKNFYIDFMVHIKFCMRLFEEQRFGCQTVDFVGWDNNIELGENDNEKNLVDCILLGRQKCP